MRRRVEIHSWRRGSGIRVVFVRTHNDVIHADDREIDPLLDVPLHVHLLEYEERGDSDVRVGLSGRRREVRRESKTSEKRSVGSLNGQSLFDLGEGRCLELLAIDQKLEGVAELHVEDVRIEVASAPTREVARLDLDNEFVPTRLLVVALSDELERCEILHARDVLHLPLLIRLSAPRDGVDLAILRLGESRNEKRRLALRVYATNLIVGRFLMCVVSTDAKLFDVPPEDEATIVEGLAVDRASLKRIVGTVGLRARLIGDRTRTLDHNRVTLHENGAPDRSAHVGQVVPHRMLVVRSSALG